MKLEDFNKAENLVRQIAQYDRLVKIYSSSNIIIKVIQETSLIESIGGKGFEHNLSSIAQEFFDNAKNYYEMRRQKAIDELDQL